MNRGYLALGAALVLVAVIGLYVRMSTDDGAPANRAPSNPRITGADPGKPAVEVTPAAPRGSVTPAAPEPSGAPATDYMVGGVHVRDHRSGEHSPIDVPPAIHPPEGRKIPSQLTSDIAQKVRAVITECAAALSPEARGATARVDGAILISIKDQKTTVTSATVQLRDVAAAAADPVKQCIEQKSVGVATSAGDEAEVSGYAITLSFRLP